MAPVEDDSDCLFPLDPCGDSIEKLSSAAVPFPVKEAMISPFRIVQLHAVQKCSGKTAVALLTGGH